MDEYLIERAKELDPEVYIRRILGGFVLNYEEPEFGSCGGDPNPTSVTELEQTVDLLFSECTDINGTDYFALDTDRYNIFLNPNATFNATVEFSWLGSQRNCPARNEGRGEIDDGSLVDGFSANIFQQAACFPVGESSLPVFTSNFSRRKIAATVYYNNNVSL